MQYPKPGPGDVSQYQVSGVPFAVSGSGAQTITFPYLTQWVWIHATSGTATVAFTQNGLTNGNSFTVGTTTALPALDLRVKSLYISGTQWEVVAGLTMVETQMWPTLSAAFAPGALGPYSGSSGFGYVPGIG